MRPASLGIRAALLRGSRPSASSSRGPPPREPARERPDPAVLARLKAHGDEVAVASVVWHELVYGVERLPPGPRRDYLARYLDEVVAPAVPVLPFDAAAAEWLGRERARLESAGRPRPVVDGMAAAVAATRGLVLVTRNTGDFGGYDGLRVEDWFGPADGSPPQLEGGRLVGVETEAWPMSTGRGRGGLRKGDGGGE